jgi:hypothetical protein
MIVLDEAQQRAVFKLIDGTALVKLLRESALTPRDVRSLMDLWTLLRPGFEAGADE